MERTSRRPADSSEKELLGNFLDFHRDTLLWKLEGLDDDQVRRPLTASGLCLLGLVKHLGWIERNWFQRTFLGQELRMPWDGDPADPDLDFRIEPGETTREVIDFYRAECARSREIVAAADLDEHARRAGRQDRTLRWIVVHMIEETARHNGHADILRELIDGATGE
jgi:hypothetical protein